MRRFSPREIEQLRLMAECGHSGGAIARSLDRPPLAIRAKAVALGIRLRPPATPFRQLRIRLPLEILDGLKAAADARGVSLPRLARQLFTIMVRDDLFSAVIDPPPIRRSKSGACTRKV